jgi:hypothetical protein
LWELYCYCVGVVPLDQVLIHLNVANIANRVTTQLDVKKMFGEPFKTGVQNGQPVWVYEDYRYSIVNENKSKDLIITFNSDGIVKSHQFISSIPASN